MIGRVATFSTASYLMSLNMKTQSSLVATEDQESSGLKAETYGGLGTDVGRLLNIDGQISRLNTDSDNATTVLASMQESYSVMGSVTDLASTILSNLSGYMSAASSDTSSLSSSASAWTNQLTSLLNTQYAGQYLFAGQAADTAPVDLSSTSYDPTADTASTGYYKGSTAGSTFYGADGYSVCTSVQANDPGFEKILRGLSLIAASPTSSTALSSAYDLIKAGSTEVAASQATLGTQSASLTSYQQDITSKVTALTSLSTTLKGSDLSAATVAVTNYQTQLEASYAAIGKLSDISLSKYLT